MNIDEDIHFKVNKAIRALEVNILVLEDWQRLGGNSGTIRVEPNADMVGLSNIRRAARSLGLEANVSILVDFVVSGGRGSNVEVLTSLTGINSAADDEVGVSRLLDGAIPPSASNKEVVVPVVELEKPFGSRDFVGELEFESGTIEVTLDSFEMIDRVQINQDVVLWTCRLVRGGVPFSIDALGGGQGIGYEWMLVSWWCS